MKMNHLGFAVRDLEKAITAYLQLGYIKYHQDIKHHEPKNMYVQRLQLDDLIVEFMAPADTEKSSFLTEALDSTKENSLLHHICYDVDDIYQTVDDLMATGEYEIYEPITAGLFQKNKICFLRHKVIGLVEFFEWPKE